MVVFGLGGVGSYAVEGLVRSGVGQLTLVDFDQVCVTNINRQLESTLTNAQATLTSANTNLAALAENLSRSLDNLAATRA